MSQNRPRLQAINLAQFGGTVLATGNGLTGPMGTTNDTVLRFTAANTGISGSGITITDSVTDGTLVSLTEEGLYLVQLALSTVEQVGATTSILAITLNSTILTGDPTYAGGALTLATSSVQLTAGVQEFTCTLEANVRVTPGQTQLVRFQASNAAGAAPTNLNVTTANFTVSRSNAAAQ